MHTITVYVNLPHEETPTMRGTLAEVLNNGLYLLLADDSYDPEDELWEFLPGSIVRCEERISSINGEQYLYAVEQVG